MLEKEVREQARPWDGPVADDWEFVGMASNQWNYFRYYRTPDGAYYFTAQRKRERYRFQYEVREEEGKTYAKRIMPKRRAPRCKYR